MRKVLTLSILSVCLFSCKNSHNEESSQQVEMPSEKAAPTAYICTGPYAKTYHADPNCKGLWNCSGEVVELPIDDVKEYRRPCRMCN